jgi:cellulose synthase/poly-beta-1,6-N-acetylglucosamine synthase-like glycosyltransferase
VAQRDDMNGSGTAGLPTPASGGDGDLVTVIIPALNEAENIERTLDSVRGQDYENLQIVVIDGGSIDGTIEAVKTHMAADPRVEMLHSPRASIPKSLNLGLAAARGRWLVRVDAHSTVNDGYVTRVVGLLRTGQWGGVGGRKNGVGRTEAGRAIAAVMGTRFGVGGSTYHHGTTPQVVDHIPFGAYPVELVRSLGGWDERLVANEDFEFDFRLRRAGYALCFDPELEIEWLCRQSVADLFRQYRRYGSGKLDVVLLHPSSMSPRHLLPPAFVAYLGLAAVGLTTRRRRRVLTSLAPYAAGLGLASASTARGLSSRAEKATVPLAYLAMHIGWGAGFWEGAMRRALRAIRRAR